MNTNCCILSWNVRGLNDSAKRESVEQTILSSGATIVCLQERKIMNWNSNLLKETLGCKLATQTIHLPSLGASGGILIACDADFFDNTTISYPSVYSLSVRVSFCLSNVAWDLKGVYGSQPENEKMTFLVELRNIRNMMKPKWLILGDFNMIRRTREKNKGSINRRVMRQFNHTIDYLQLLELDLNGKLYTWSNVLDLLWA
jgi:exonuclease III